MIKLCILNTFIFRPPDGHQMMVKYLIGQLISYEIECTS
jgi:hypothetical protein